MLHICLDSSGIGHWKYPTKKLGAPYGKVGSNSGWAALDREYTGAVDNAIKRDMATNEVRELSAPKANFEAEKVGLLNLSPFAWLARGLLLSSAAGENLFVLGEICKGILIPRFFSPKIYYIGATLRIC